MSTATPEKKYYLLASASLIALLLLCISWEWFLAPLRPGGSWMVLKTLPLLIPLRGVLKRDNYTMQWSSMLIWLYFTEGIVRAYSDRSPLSVALALAEVGLSILFFIAVILYLRPLKKAAKALAKVNAANVAKAAEQ
ncbi:DUF2069 domain-containing protein [Undibacterium sp. TC4M20W]|uniref:DUF2069 domain-containing protein n=1 Tax=Undibacterium sp. TC4M20W TaxID=3413052 RepID=UPI003BF2ED67